jgi:hypothetical protein
MVVQQVHILSGVGSNPAATTNLFGKTLFAFVISFPYNSVLEVIMKKLFVVSLYLSCVPLAMATGTTPPVNQNNNHLTNNNHSTNNNHNSNTNANTNISVSSSESSSHVTNSVTASGGHSSATGGSVGNTTSGSNSSATGGSVGNTTSGSTSVSSADGAGANSNNVTMVENYQAYRIPVTTAIAASLTSGNDTCLGSASGGVQTQVLGISLGRTLRDKNCEMIKQVQLLQQMGMPNAACYRARAGDEGRAIDEAMTRAGIDCATMTQPAASEIDTSKYVTREELIERDNRMFRRNQK